MSKDGDLQVISTAALFDLMGRLDGAKIFDSEKWVLLPAILGWATEFGMLERSAMPAPGRVEISALALASGRMKITADIMPAHAAADVPPPVKEAKDNPVPDCAPEPAVVHIHTAPEPKPDPAPEPAVASPPTPAPKVAAPEAPVKKAQLWSEAEDAEAVAMRAAGKSAAEIAAKLGRPVPATSFRIYHNLKDRIVAARAGLKKAASPVPAAAPNRAPSASWQMQALADGLARAAPPVVTAREVTSGPAETTLTKPAWWRTVEANLKALGHKAPWTPALDLALADGLARGVSKDLLADQLGVEVGALIVRWRALMPDGPSIDYQGQLLTVLRDRAPRRAAAE